MPPSADAQRDTRPRQQCADAVLMVRPKAFGYNPEPALTNTFQSPAQPGSGDACSAARQEFERLAQALASEGVAVCAREDSTLPAKPDAVFPNNWVSFHEDGTLVLYPLQTASRRFERRPELIEAAVRALGFQVSHLLDLTWFEGEGKYLEGTGSLVLDNIARVAYACLSPRTHPEVLAEWSQALGYEVLTFSAADRGGVPLYHTQVVVVNGGRAGVHGRAGIAPTGRARGLGHLGGRGREIIENGHGEMERFASNNVELGPRDEALGDSRVLVMSDSARR